MTRIASRLNDERHLPHLLAILYTCGGTPSIYAGDEQAFRSVKEERAGGDDAIRPALPPTPASLAPYGLPIYWLHQSLLALRRRHTWLHRTCVRKVHLTNEQLVLTMAGEHQHLLLIEIGEGGLVAGGDRAAQVSLGPHSWAILSA